MRLALIVHKIILSNFEKYLEEFQSITQHSKGHFEKQEWTKLREASQKRLKLYDKSVKSTVKNIRQELGSLAQDKLQWYKIKNEYIHALLNHKAIEIAESYYNSVCRKMFKKAPVNNDIMFIYSEAVRKQLSIFDAVYKSYYLNNSVSEALYQILQDFQFDISYENLERDIDFIDNYLQNNILNRYVSDAETRIDILKSIFYRNKAAYLIGRIIIEGKIVPFVLPLMHRETGIYVDALITDENDVSIIFSFTRSYFMVNVNIPSQEVSFLKTILPKKSLGELYNSIGFSKHGKTQFYRDFLQHLNYSDDQFIIAPGTKGMVMTVFTLPSYNIVFKVIKDKFDPPKKVSRQTVIDKYTLVKEHDRVGRMADTHEFTHFEIDLNRVSPSLLEELKKVASNSIKINDEKIYIKHLFTERKVIPLNLYLQKANLDKAKVSINNYGLAIKELAAGNIFPGDMLLKNFGVTRHGRVIFYDYDEIEFLTDCNFRTIPEPRNWEEEMSGDVWYHVGPKDIFPEEFIKFLFPQPEIRKYFLEKHQDLFEAKFWNQLKTKLLEGEVMDVFPYAEEKRFENKN